MPDGRRILPPCKAKIAGILDVFQDFLMWQGSKRPVQMAFNVREYRSQMYSLHSGEWKKGQSSSAAYSKGHNPLPSEMRVSVHIGGSDSY